jgi:hypothetical protein
MSLQSARPEVPMVGDDPIYLRTQRVSAKTTYRLCLEAVQQCPGLIHGQLSTSDGVCALGSMNEHQNEKYPNGINTPWCTAERIQKYNDSMPDASPEVRRAMVIAWLKNQIALYL